MKGVLVFLGRFLIIAGLFYGIWEALAPVYLLFVTPVVDGLFAGLQLPVQLEQHGRALLLVYRFGEETIRLQAHDYDVVYLNMIAAAALILATPGQRLEWRLRWLAGTLGLLWITHVASFFASGQIAIWQFLDVQPFGPERAALAGQIQVHFSPEGRRICEQLLAQWNVWGRYALAVGIWFFALRRQVIGRMPGFIQQHLGRVYVFRLPQAKTVLPRKIRRRTKKLSLKRAS